MKRGKWIFRYALVFLVVALCLRWCLYCKETISRLKGILGSAEYIDMAARLDPLTVDLLERLALFEGLRTQSFWMLGIAIGGLVLLMAGHILTFVRLKKPSETTPKPKKEKKQKLPKVKKVPPVQPAPAPAQEKHPGYCTQCGAYYEDLPNFCTKCGAKQAKL